MHSAKLIVTRAAVILGALLPGLAGCSTNAGDSISTYKLKGKISKPIITNISVLGVAVH